MKLMRLLSFMYVFCISYLLLSSKLSQNISNLKHQLFIYNLVQFLRVRNLRAA